MPANLTALHHGPPGKHPDIERVLVIGGAGVIGRSLIAGLRNSGYLVRALQHRTVIEPGPGVEVFPATASQDGLAAALQGVQAVCVYVRVAGEATPEEWIECTIRNTRNLLEASRGSRLCRIVIGCGDNVFGVPTRPSSPVLTETSARMSNGTNYSMFKILEQELIQQYRSIFNLPVVVTLFPLVWRDDLLATGLRAVDHKAKVIYHDVDEAGADLVRPGIHVSDATQAILLALREECGIGQNFLFSGPKAFSSSQLISILQRVFPYPVEVVRRKWHSWSIDDSKAADLLGYSPQVELLEWLAHKYLRAAESGCTGLW
jgi:nucleoside-diphosphate-sugar epimerase